MTRSESRPNVLEEARLLFESATLSLPPVPEEFQSGGLRRIDKWAYASRDIEPMDMYRFGRYAAEAVSSDIPDYVAFCHAGYGSNSYSINYHLLLGQMALFVQVLWGGVYTDNVEQARKVRECFSQCAELVQGLTTSERATRWPRLIVAQSDFRSVNIAAWLKEPLSTEVAAGEWLRGASKGARALDQARVELRMKSSSTSRFVWQPGDLEIVKRFEPEQGFYLLER